MTKEECEVETSKAIMEMRNHIEELEKELEQAKKVQVVEHFEAYGQCRDSRRIASLEKENAELKDKLKNLESVAEVRLANWQKYEKENEELKEQIEKMKCWHKMDYNDKESCKKIPRGIQLLTEYDCGLFVAYCVNRWTGDHWEEHTYGVTAWKEIELSKEIKEK